ncbi:sensor histidine kinase [Pseudothauera nasutitermitis]|uniref:histidine kinase n=2 Tax=Pseudothauera nasutitermitis TaxID=2565930 RepID=A0A4S4AXX7_9RHOO|nr:sensor histidine kinase [Pseudothauera nasutitermitis]
MPTRFSLRRRVAAWLLPPLVILLLVNAVLSYQSALDAVNRAYDRSLTAALRAVAERTHSLAGQIHVDIPYAAFEVFEESGQERVYYAVIDPQGEVLTGYAGLAPDDPPPPSGEVHIRNARFLGEEVRLAAQRKRLYDPELGDSDAVTIVFAESTGSRDVLVRELFLGSLRRQLLLVAAGGVLIMLALASAFRPLLALRNAIRQRHAEDLTPVPDTNIPNEVRPLIDAINHHMARLSAMLAARRRFLADAAHQIRTPLAVLGTQAEYGMRQRDPEEMRRTLASLHASVRGARRLANQMLTLSHAEAVNGLIGERAELDFTALARETALELAPLALRKRIALEFEGADTSLRLHGNAAMLREMIANLIDNALRYSPQDARVVVAVAARAGGGAVLRVSDSGPGIAKTERENVFKRFYRILGQGDSEGSGLGLAIVREICWAHGGRIALKDGEHGRGLCVEVELPRSGKP